VRQALREGALRGGSTISQQTVKNAFLWPGRNWLRKAVEALLTPYIEMVWSKRRLLEIYLNIAEFDTGVFGIEAAAWHHFGVAAKDLNRVQGRSPCGRSARSQRPQRNSSEPRHQETRGIGDCRGLI
jgi:monofunctional biosynthetic peptidoglycan transglycosylase